MSFPSNQSSSSDIIIALITGTIVGFSLAAAYFTSSSSKIYRSGHQLEKSNENSVLDEVKEEKKPIIATTSDPNDDDDGVQSTSEEEDEDPGAEPHKMVMVVNESLKMGKGKIAAQCCHGCLGAYKRASEKALLVWRSQGQAKIAVKGQDESDLTRVSSRISAFSL
jgi:hypothetical protein